MKKRSFFKSLRLNAVTCFAVTLASASVFAAVAFNGAAFTTNSTGASVNQNIFQLAADVYINGGPNNANASGLPPNEIFYFEVTDPSGRVLLSSDAVICRQVQTDANGRIFGAYAGDGCSHTVGTVDASNGSLPVRLWPFNRTPNAGNEYKVILVRKDAPGVSVESDGYHLDYPRSATKSDNFKVLNYTSSGGGGDETE